MNRPALLLLLLTLLHLAVPAHAKDGDSGGSNSGSDSDNSGHGSSDDDDDDDEDDDRDDDDGNDRDGDDSKRARDGVSSGKLLPLAHILNGLDSRFAGRLLDASLKQRRGREVYEIQLISPEGRVIELRVDAGTGKLIGYRIDD